MSYVNVTLWGVSIVLAVDCNVSYKSLLGEAFINYYFQKMKRFGYRIIKFVGLLTLCLIGLLFVLEFIVYRVYLPQLWIDKMMLISREEKLYVYASKSYGRKEIVSMSRMVKQAIKELESKNISIQTETSLYFTNTFDEYEQMTLTRSSQSRALTLHGRNIFFSPVELTDETLFIDGGDSALCVVLHELTHIYQYNNLIFHGKFVDKWKIEGYADYIAEKSFLNLSEGSDLLIHNNGNEDDVYYLYFIGRLRTDFLLRHKGIPEDEYWDTNYDTDKLDDEIREALRSGEYRAFEQ